MIELDSSVRRIQWDLLIGGSPRRVIRLSHSGAEALDGLLSGAQADPQHRLENWLVQQGLAHRTDALLPDFDQRVSVVIPVHVAGGDFRLTLPAGLVRVIVVDDGNSPPLTPGPDVILVRTGSRPLGPSSARNHGAAHSTSQIIAFVDHDIVLPAGALEALAGHFSDVDVIAVAPRIVSLAQAGLASLLEQGRCALDLGPNRSLIGPGKRVTYVPAAVLMIRRSAFDEVGGFDPAMHLGEDVDLCWRLTRSGRMIYDPQVVVGHAPRGRVVEVLRRRSSYGQSAATLERRHPGEIRHAEFDFWLLAALAGLLLDGPRGAMSIGALAAERTRVALPQLPTQVAIALSLESQYKSWLELARYSVRPALPLTLLSAVVSARVRRNVAPVLLCAYTLDLITRARVTRGVSIDRDGTAHLNRVPTVMSVVAGVADDLSYSWGVWKGCAAERTIRPLIPRVRWKRSRPRTARL